MKKFLFFAVSLFASLLLEAQDMIQSYVISIENGKVYMDVTTPKVKVGDVLSIREEAGYMVHPVTKRKIKKEGAILADLEVVEVYGEYSVATIYPEGAVKKIKVGMIAEMPELPQRYADVLQGNSEMPDDVEDEELPVVPLDADGIVRRYLQVTGLDKWMNRSSFPPFYKKEQLSYTTTKGKGGTSSIYSAFDLSARKLFVRFDSPEDNLFLVYSKAYAVNGYEGWFRFKKNKTTEIKSKYLMDIWNNQSDIFALRIYDTSKWERTLSGKREIRGKVCSGVAFVLKNPEIKKQEITRVIQYFDDNTGLISHTENNLGVQSECLSYKQFGDLLLCAQAVATYTEGKIKEEVTVLQEVCFDCPLNSSLFSKEGVKQAFK